MGGIKMKFIKFKINNYKIFGGENEISFDKKINFILGNSGAGKTTLFNALKSSFIKSNSKCQLITTRKSKKVLSNINTIFLDGEQISDVQYITKITKCNSINQKEMLKLLKESGLSDKFLIQDIHLKTNTFVLIPDTKILVTLRL